MVYRTGKILLATRYVDPRVGCVSSVQRRLALYIPALILSGLLLSGSSAIASHGTSRVVATFLPDAAPSGWVAADSTQVTISCTGDSESCDRFYRVDGGAVVNYEAPFAIQGDGIHTLDAATNLADFENADHDTYVVRLDGTPPTITIDATCTQMGLEGWCVGLYTYSVTATDASSGLAAESPSCALDGVTAPCVGTLATSGLHSLAVAARDAAGNAADSAVVLKIDNLPPTAALLIPPTATPAPDGWFLSSFSLTNASADADSGLANVEYSIDGGGWFRLASPTAPAIVGDHTYAVRATDRAGNVGSALTRVRLDPTTEDPRVLSTSGAGTTTFTAGTPLTATHAVLRPGDDTGETRISFAFDVPMDRNSVIGNLMGASGWDLSWGNDDLWLNLTRADLPPGASASVSIASGALGRHGGSLSGVTRTALGRSPINYTFAPTSYDFVNITGNGTDAQIYCDDCSREVALPFEFSFFNRTYTSLNISSNGFVSFNGSSTSEYSPGFLPGTSASNLIAAYWEDLQTDLGGRAGNLDRVVTRSIGAAPARVFLISWSVVHHYPNIQPTATFQIKLFESTNRIEIHYENAMSDGGRHLVGIMDSTRTMHLTYTQADVSFVRTAIAITGERPSRDILPPVIAPHEHITAEATSALGAAVTYAAPGWTDDSGESGVAACAPASGATFALGDTLVTCSASDAAGNAATSEFTVRVRDSTPPAIAPHGTLRGEATGPDGAILLYDPPTWTDLVSGSGSATCFPPPGSSFRLGETSVTCSARDGAGNEATSSFLVRVADTTAPTIAPHADVGAEATNASGAEVTYDAPTYTDAVSGPGTAACAPASGSLFALGATTVVCSATDTAGNAASSTFTVLVYDTTAPVIATPHNVTAEATQPGGAHVTYVAPSYADAVSGTGNATCSPPSGSLFPLGETTVKCAASDAAGNVASTSFVVTVVDTTPPVVSIALDPAAPQGIGGWYTSPPVATIRATDTASGVNGTTIDYSLDGSNWTPGTTFSAWPQNATTLYARARDFAGNLGSANITVKHDNISPNVTSSGFALQHKSALLFFNFSEPMDRTNVEAALFNLTGWIPAWNNESTSLVLSNASVDIGTREVGIGRGATDSHGAPLSENHTTNYTRPPDPRPVFPPDPPFALAATLTDGLVRLGWSPPEIENGAPVTSFRVYVDDRAPVAVTGTYYDAGALARGAVHRFAVTAVNSAGESQPARGELAIPPVSTLHVDPPSTTGWYRERPLVRFTVQPGDAEISYDLGEGWTPSTGSLLLPEGEVQLRWRASAGGVEESERVRTFLVDATPPTITDASASGGEEIVIRARATDAHAGIVAVEAIVTPRGIGDPFLVPLFREGGEYTSRAGAPVGAYDVAIVAHDAAGHETRASAGAVHVVAPPILPVGGPPSPFFIDPNSVSVPLERTSTSGANDPGQTSTQDGSAPSEAPTDDDAPSPEIQFDADNFAAGVRGTIVIRLVHVDSVERIRWVLVHPNGTEVELASATADLSWDTTTVPDGYYIVEARRGQVPAAPGEITIQSSHETTLASARVLVRNPTVAPVEVAGAVVGAVLVAAATQTALSAAASGATSSMTGAAGGFDPFGFAQEVAIDAGQDKLRDKTRERDRKRRIRSMVAGAVSLAILAPLWAFSETNGWSLTAWIPLVPVVGIAAALVIAMKYSAESALAFSTGARPRIRLWIAGMLSLLVSAVVFRNPFGYPAYVDEVDESEGKHTWRMQAGRALATIAGATAFMLPFLILAPWTPWTFASVGILLAITNVATSAIPFGPLPGRDVWRWNKLVAVIVAVGGFGLYVGFASALAPVWTLWAVSIAGAVAYTAALLRFRHRQRERGVRVPVHVPVPVVEGEPAAPPAPEATPAQAGDAPRKRTKPKRGRGGRGRGNA